MMRGPWEQSRAAGGRRTRRVGAPVSGAPFNFSSDLDDPVDPVEFLAIRADDELLDELSGGRFVGAAYKHRFQAGIDDGYADDRRVLALLAELRAEIDSVPFPELVSVDQACEAISRGPRQERSRRWLMSVAAAAAVTVLALGGVAAAAGNAQPGDPLWGVSAALDGNRARSVEAAYRVDTALATAARALAEGRVTDARVALAAVAPDLDKVADPDRRGELARKAQNLYDTADEAHEGEPVPTDEHGAPRDSSWAKRRGRSNGTGTPTGGTGGGSAKAGQHRPGHPDPGEMLAPGNAASAVPAQPQPGTAGSPETGGPGLPGFPSAPGTSNQDLPGDPTPGASGTPGPGGPGDQAAGNSGMVIDPRTGRPIPDPRRTPPAKPSGSSTAPPPSPSNCPRPDSANPNNTCPPP